MIRYKHRQRRVIIIIPGFFCQKRELHEYNYKKCIIAHYEGTQKSPYVYISCTYSYTPRLVSTDYK